MARMKRAAGIPLAEDSATTRPRPALAPKKQPPPPAVRVPEKIKAAGITERLASAVTTFPQPPNPHLLKTTILGPANVGKSTLVNALVGEKVSIVSRRAQTTRERVVGVMTDGSTQIVFQDTPGIVSQLHRHRVNRQVIVSSWSSVQAIDHLIVMLDAAKLLYKDKNMTEEYMFGRLTDYDVPATLLLNKVDELLPAELLQQPDSQAYSQLAALGHPQTPAKPEPGVDLWAALSKHPERYQDIAVRASPKLAQFGKSATLHQALRTLVEQYRTRYTRIGRVLACSAQLRWGLDGVREHLKQLAVPAHHMYPSQQTTETAALALVEQFVREGFFQRLWGYVPYALQQENTQWLEMPDGTLRIVQTVYVTRAGQEKIVVGRAGTLVKQVQDHAKAELERLLKRPVELYVDVKVRRRRPGKDGGDRNASSSFPHAATVSLNSIHQSSGNSQPKNRQLAVLSSAFIPSDHDGMTIERSTARGTSQVLPPTRNVITASQGDPAAVHKTLSSSDSAVFEFSRQDSNGVIDRLMAYMRLQDTIPLNERRFGAFSRGETTRLCIGCAFSLANHVAGLTFVYQYVCRCQPVMMTFSSSAGCWMWDVLFVFFLGALVKEVQKFRSLATVLRHVHDNSYPLTWHYAFLAHSTMLLPMLWRSAVHRDRVHHLRALSIMFHPTVVLCDLFLGDLPIALYAAIKFVDIYSQLSDATWTARVRGYLSVGIPLLLTTTGLGLHFSRFFWRSLVAVGKFQSRRRRRQRRQSAMRFFVTAAHEHVMVCGSTAQVETVVYELSRSEACGGMDKAGNRRAVAADLLRQHRHKYMSVMETAGLTTLSHLLDAIELLGLDQLPALTPHAADFRQLLQKSATVLRTVAREPLWTAAVTDEVAATATVIWRHDITQAVYALLTGATEEKRKWLKHCLDQLLRITGPHFRISDDDVLNMPRSGVEAFFSEVEHTQPLQLMRHDYRPLCLVRCTPDNITQIHGLKLIDLVAYVVFVVDMNGFDDFVSVRRHDGSIRQSTQLRFTVDTHIKYFEKQLLANRTATVVVVALNYAQYKKRLTQEYVASIEQRLRDSYTQLQRAPRPLTPDTAHAAIKQLVSTLMLDARHQVQLPQQRQAELMTDRDGLVREMDRFLSDIKARWLTSQVG
ncbi:hypothetical protein RI367_005181 [Sorochytrium milnesiophthora]